MLVHSPWLKLKIPLNPIDGVKMKKTLIFSICSLMLATLSTVSLAQEKKPNSEMLHKMFARMDKNSDGTLDGDEMPEKLKEKLTKLDANSDGKIDKTELASARQKGQGPKPSGERGKPGNMKPGQGQPGERQTPPNRGAEMLKRLDKNGDGKIATDELPEKLQPRLAKLDANGDGFIDEAELKSIKDRMEGAKGEKGPDGNRKRAGGKNARGGNPDGQAPQKPQRPDGDA